MEMYPFGYIHTLQEDIMSARTQKIVVRLSRKERQAVERLASSEKLPASTLARVMLLKAADQHNAQLVSTEGAPDHAA
jgi:hypothetical protein